MRDVGRSRVRTVLGLGLCGVLVLVLSLNALRRMDYFDPATAQHIRMTDASRTAYVAKNIAEGRGYTTNDLPAALVDFYDQRGKLHDEHWVNADRFPFAAYATAALYLATGSTSWEVGILVYNLIFFVGFLVLLFRTTHQVWSERYAALFAVAIALIHPYTWMFLYWKDGDMLFLTMASVACAVRYYRTPAGTLPRWFALAFGSLLAFVFLARPNLGVAFLLFIGVSIVARWWSARGELGSWPALRRLASRELLIPVAVILWCVPFIAHSMSEWGAPLFSANNLYQLPLGTRYGMGTDTWWKYTEPGQLPTFGVLAHQAGDELLTKFTSSWAVTLRHVMRSYALELLLATGLVVWLGSRTDPAERTSRPLRIVAAMIMFAVVVNLLVLPLYSYQSYSFRHYLAFALPLLWLAAGRAVVVLAEQLGPVAGTLRDHVRTHARWYVLFAVVGLLAVNVGVTSQPDQTRLFARTGKLFGDHWVGTLLVLAVVMFRRQLLRPPWFPRVVVVVFSLVYACYRPSLAMKRTNAAFFALDAKVWDSLRQRTGLVSSFALQSEVAWNTGRKNIPAPEWPMHIYSLLADHKLEVEDLYIESAGVMVSSVDGPFYEAAPGFEGYARLETYQAMPGYEVAFHSEAVRGYPKFRVKPRLKASTVFRLSDRAAVQAMLRSPERIELGQRSNVIYTAHGWERYYTIEGKQTVVATDVTRDRYTGASDGPWEDASTTFFLDPARSPKAVEIEFYAPRAISLQFYWNLDLYAYDRPGDRNTHRVGSVAATAGWNRVRLEVPPRLLRRGLNKLGFRSDGFTPVALCGPDVSETACAAGFATLGPSSDFDVRGQAPRVVKADISETRYEVASLFASSLQFFY